MTVEDVMTRDVITVTPATPIHEAASLMVEHGVSGLPVIDAEGRLVGIISDGDLIVRQRRRKETPWWHLFFPISESAVPSSDSRGPLLRPIFLRRSGQWTETLPLANQLSSRVTLPPLSDTIRRGAAISPLRRSQLFGTI
jgi:hypothetical protein